MSNSYDDHAAAVLALLRAGANLTDKVYDGKIPDPRPAPPYVQVYISRERPRGAEGNTLAGTSDQIILRAICHCVGGGDDAVAARAMAAAAEAALLDVVPAISGRECQPIALESSQPPQPDETTGTLYMDQIDTYRLVTTPSA